MLIPLFLLLSCSGLAFSTTFPANPSTWYPHYEGMSLTYVLYPQRYIWYSTPGFLRFLYSGGPGKNTYADIHIVSISEKPIPPSLLAFLTADEAFIICLVKLNKEGEFTDSTFLERCNAVQVELGYGFPALFSF